jgi:hypothetical protein
MFEEVQRLPQARWQNSQAKTRKEVYFLRKYIREDPLDLCGV